MNKNLTDSEIIKALEWCEQFTDNLVMADINTKKRTLGLQAMRTCKNALDLINRLQAENERLKADCENYKQVAENQQKVSMDIGFEIKRLKAEVEELKSAINGFRDCWVGEENDG